MSILRIFFTLIVFSTTSSLAQNFNIKGQIIDAETSEPLAFVTIAINNGNSGTTSNIDGYFNISSKVPIEKLTFSYVGYEKLEVNINSSQSHIFIQLNPQSRVLNEVVVLPGVNPALAIIDRLIQNKKNLEPSNLKAYKYTSYNKFQVGSDILPEINTQDSSQIELLKFLSSQYLFSMESITERYFKKPGKTKDKVIANRVSGFKNLQMTTLASSFQTLGFFDDYIEILGVSFLNPISKNSDKKYYFDLLDSLIDDQSQKIYIIQFQPKNKNFNGLVGTMHIDAEDNALKNIIAETARYEEYSNNLYEANKTLDTTSQKADSVAYILKTNDNLNFRIQQSYTRVKGGVWFPNQLKSDFFFGAFQKENAPEFPLMGISKSYIQNIDLKPNLKGVDFSRVVLEYEDDANKKEEVFWSEFRKDSLTAKELETYVVLDSIIQGTKVEQLLNLIPIFLEKKIPLGGAVDINLRRAFDVNEFEGFRAGIGLSTSEKISKTFELGGYWAYGFRDKEDKFGGYLNIHLLKNNKLDVFGQYSNEVEQFGGSSFYNYETSFAETNSYYRYIIDNMITVEQFEAGAKFYWLKYLDTQVSLRNRNISVNDEYQFASGPELADSINSFEVTEIALKFGYNFGQDYIQVFNGILPTQRSGLYVGANFYRSINNFWNSDFGYNKIELFIDKQFRFRNFGSSFLAIKAGYVDRVIPAASLFNITGTRNELLEIGNTFRTMGINEFAADQYISVFYQHTVAQFTINPKFSKPRFLISGAVAYGDLQNSERHLNDTFTPLDNAYYETGLLIRNILRAKFLSLGFGAYRRLGPFELEDTSDNYSYKLDVVFDLGS